MTAVARGCVAGVLALSLSALSGTTASAEDAKSVALAKELAAALTAAKLDSIAATDPAAPDAFVEPVREAPAICPLGGREQLRGKAGARALELDAHGTPVGKREVERDEAREVAVRFEQQRRTDQLSLSKRAQR